MSVVGQIQMSRPPPRSLARTSADPPKPDAATTGREQLQLDAITKFLLDHLVSASEQGLRDRDGERNLRACRTSRKR